MYNKVSQLATLACPATQVVRIYSVARVSRVIGRAKVTYWEAGDGRKRGRENDASAVGVRITENHSDLDTS